MANHSAKNSNNWFSKHITMLVWPDILTTSVMMEKVSVAVKAIDPYDHQVDCWSLTRTELEQIDLERYNAIHVRDKSFKVYA